MKVSLMDNHCCYLSWFMGFLKPLNPLKKLFRFDFRMIMSDQGKN